MKANRFSQLSGLLIAGCLVAAGFVMLIPSAFAETTLQRIQRTGEVRIGYANEAPFAYTAPDGTVTANLRRLPRRSLPSLASRKSMPC
jgi:polar amino acid transport system substrate-binding protein